MDNSTTLITGSSGQLGKALRLHFPKATAASSTQLDISDAQQVKDYDWSGIKVVINAAAYTNVDGAETNDGRVDAWQTNAVGVRNLSIACQEHDLTFVHISSEYVFDGNNSPHLEDEPFSPLGVYGQTKAAGDITASTNHKHYIIRTSWVVGDGHNFVRTMISLAIKGISPTVIADDIGRPTFTSELVKAIDHLLTTSAPFGTYNVSNSGDPVSWADLTRAIFIGINTKQVVNNITDKEYYADKPLSAKRPANSIFALEKIKSTGFKSNDWREDLKKYLIKEQEST